ncbi:hypothetical protein ACJIZ3_024809 [Penstemon smallii]|uniref:RING-type E3 ubiquitin transferase n=1 Tax=Penstemon smallii TaxID=265156 RepID=A0ABD3TT05_9LAMI
MIDDSIRINPPGRYKLNVAIEVTNQHNHVYDASDDMNENLMMTIIDQSMSEISCPRMVPATISSIESLKTTEFACANNGNCERCSICLDEFFNGCIVVHMPCNHSFHRDCISEWLRSSHCCPNCRFEMPTN